MKNYVEIVAKYYKEFRVTCNGDSSDYSTLIWDTDSVSQADLDSKYLEFYKASRNSEIDSRTGELIKQGFSYKSSLFSLSEPAQINWIGIMQAASSNIITYPMSITTIDDCEYELVDAPDVTGFYLTGLGTKTAYLDSGRALKMAVEASVSTMQVDSIIDNR